MSLTLVPHTADKDAKWDAFVAASRNGTFFHTRRFLAYHPEGRFADASFWVMDGETPVAVLPAAIKDSKLIAHPGASYGGVVLAANVGVKESGEILAAITEHAKAKKLAGMSFVRLTPQSIRQGFSDDQEYWMFQQGWTCTRFEMDGAIDASALTEELLMGSLTGKCRNMVRQAERAGISVKVTQDFAGFWKILEATLTGRHGTKPTHTVEEIIKLKTLCPNDVRLFGAYKADVLVGGIVVVTINNAALYTLYMAQDYAHQKEHPMHMILVEVLKAAIREKRRTLHLGVSTEDGGKVINEGLCFFKESFGCKPVRRESWELPL